MKHLKNNNSFRVFIALLLAISSSSVLAQNEGDAGGEGGDAGGGNATCTYSYQNFNDLDVQMRANGYIGFQYLKEGNDKDGEGTDFPFGL